MARAPTPPDARARAAQAYKAARAGLSVIDGRPDAPARIALSLVHPRGRIDIPVKDVLKIEALAEETFFFGDTQTSKTFQAPHVRLEFKPHIRARIFRLTSQIVGEEFPIIVAGEVICRPVVREPLGLHDWFNIRVSGLEQARDLAAKLREGWINPDLKVV
jgi:preprotein translocase subunit SecD